MAVSCDKHSADYLRLLMQLLPPGYAWQWSPSSVGRHLLAAWADELARVHQHFCTLVDHGIRRFAGNLSGWSAEDYERLLAGFGIEAQVSDGLMPFSCESGCTDYLLEESIRYVIVFTVEDARAISQEVHDHLALYKQSHTHYLFRDRSLSVERVIAVDSMHLGEAEHEALNPFYPSRAGQAEADDPLIETEHTEITTVVTDGLHCESPLYEQRFEAYQLACHWSFSVDELRQFPEWPAIATDIEQAPGAMT